MFFIKNAPSFSDRYRRGILSTRKEPVSPPDSSPDLCPASLLALSFSDVLFLQPTLYPSTVFSLSAAVSMGGRRRSGLVAGQRPFALWRGSTRRVVCRYDDGAVPEIYFLFQ